MSKNEIIHNASKDAMDVRSKRRYRVVFNVFRPLLGLFTRFQFRYKAIPFYEEKDKTYLIVSNHTGALDPIFLAQSFKRPIFFVASDHLFRSAFIRNLLDFLVAPIPISKSRIDLKAIRDIKTCLDNKHTVAIFPSGNRSRSGPEEPIPPATGKLLKILKSPVLFYRIEGGYLSSPRWARHPRKGQMSGEVVMHLTKEDLAKHSVEEIDEMLKNFTDANPYLPNRKNNIPYRGRRRAEYLERLLWICPSCLGITTLQSENHTFSCSCGFSIVYEKTGYFGPASYNEKDEQWAKQFPHVDALYQWQKNTIKQIFTKEWFDALDENQAIFTDEGERLIETQRARRNLRLLKGTIRLYKNRLEYIGAKSGEKRTFALKDLHSLSVIGPQLLQFHDRLSDKVYESVNKNPRSAYKYIDMIQQIHCLQSRKKDAVE